MKRPLSLLLVSLVLLSCFSIFKVKANPDTEILAVDGFDSTFTQWGKFGFSPYLNTNDSDTSYVQSNTNNYKIGYFAFQNTTFTSITDVHLFFRARFTTGVDGNMFTVFNVSVKIVGTVGPTSTSYSNYQADPGSQLNFLDTPEEINGFKCYLQFNAIGGLKAPPIETLTGYTIRSTYAYLVVEGSSVEKTWYEIDSCALMIITRETKFVSSLNLELATRINKFLDLLNITLITRSKTLIGFINIIVWTIGIKLIDYINITITTISFKFIDSMILTIQTSLLQIPFTMIILIIIVVTILLLTGIFKESKKC